MRWSTTSFFSPKLAPSCLSHGFVFSRDVTFADGPETLNGLGTCLSPEDTRQDRFTRLSVTLALYRGQPLPIVPSLLTVPTMREPKENTPPHPHSTSTPSPFSMVRLCCGKRSSGWSPLHRMSMPLETRVKHNM